MGRAGGRQAPFFPAPPLPLLEAWGSPRLRGRVGVRQRHFLQSWGPPTGALLSQERGRLRTPAPRGGPVWDQPPPQTVLSGRRLSDGPPLWLMRTQAHPVLYKRGSGGCQGQRPPGPGGRPGQPACSPRRTRAELRLVWCAERSALLPGDLSAEPRALTSENASLGPCCD